jgi:hypothetical protein
MPTRNHAAGPPKGSIAYDRLMQAANPPPPRRHPAPEYYDDEYDVYDDRRAWSRVAYPYQFKWDGVWIFVAVLAALGGLAAPDSSGIIALAIAGFIAFMRCVVWCCFRFPLTSWFFVVFIAALLGGGRRRRW